LRRLFANATEAGRAARKQARGGLAPFATADASGVEIHGAAWVDLPTLLTLGAGRWRASGVLREATVTRDDLRADATGVVWRGERFACAVLCVGGGALARELFPALPFEAAKGEILHVTGAELPVGYALSRGTWAIADLAGHARIGATYEPGVEDVEPTIAAREKLLAEARGFVAGNFAVVDQRVGVRVSLPDRLPAVGWRGDARIGFFGALGSKGTLFAPWLAQRWSEVLRGGMNDWPEALNVARYSSRRAPAR
jgi:hypothetical protein